MQNKKNFLIEIGTEELPPKDLSGLIKSFSENLIAELNKENIDFSRYETFATPRRLAIIIFDMPKKQPDKILKNKGPKVSIAFDKNNNPTKAAIGFAKSNNTDLSNLKTITEKDGIEHLYFEKKIHGKNTFDLLKNAILNATHKIHIRKKMRWGNHNDFFVRPIHWVLALFDNKIIPFEFFNIKSSNKTFGHRFMSPTGIEVNDILKYEQLLEKDGVVIPSLQKRKDFILSLVNQNLKDLGLNNCIAIIPDNLLDEVVALVEYPVILVGNFKETFLSLPKEVLISSIIEHQKCFPIEDKNKNLISKFFIISNLKSKNAEIIIRGNEKVMHARLEDAAFHYDFDKKNSLYDYAKNLKNIIFQKQLGSLFDKITRISSVAKHFANLFNTSEKLAKEASLLCKADLLTNMVFEFPELQGHMGYYYALNEGIDTNLALSIKEHYMPISANANLPTTNLGLLISIADKIDTLVGLFGINKIPTGEKDPFALRRQAIAVLRILIEKEINLDLSKLINFVEELFAKTKIKFLNKNLKNDLLLFFMERLKNFYHQQQNISINIFNAVHFNKIYNILDFSKRINALANFVELPSSTSLINSNKRVKNILGKSKNVKLSNDVNENLLKEPAEKNLYSKILKIEKLNTDLIKKGDYFNILKNLTNIDTDLELFFEKVMVMCEDQKLKENRLKLLQKIRANFLKIADISLL